MSELISILEINNLRISYGSNVVISDLSFNVANNQYACVVGKSGIGKTSIVMAIAGLLNEKSSNVSGQIKICGQDIAFMKFDQRAKFCRDKVAIMLQDSLASLNPSMTVGKQMLELVANKKIAKAKSLAALSQVGFENPKEIFNLYPAELSGGMRQKVCFAMAIINTPKLLILDEPYANLDNQTQTDLLALLDEYKRTNELAVLLITHNLDIVKSIADVIINLDNK